jgi:hypothetical protein
LPKRERSEDAPRHASCADMPKFTDESPIAKMVPIPYRIEGRVGKPFVLTCLDPYSTNAAHIGCELEEAFHRQRTHNNRES